VLEVNRDRISSVGAVIADLYAQGVIRKSFVLEFWADGADEQHIPVLLEDCFKRCKLSFPNSWVFRLVESVDDHWQPVASSLTSGIHSCEEKLHGLNRLTSNCHSASEVIECVGCLEVTAE